MFSGCTVQPDIMETKLRSSNQETSPSAGKVTRVVLSCSHMQVHPYNYFGWCGYFLGPWVSFVITGEFWLGSQKLLQGLVSHELTAILSIFNLFKLDELWLYCIVWNLPSPLKGVRGSKF